MTEEPTCPCDVEDDEQTLAGVLHVELNHLWGDMEDALRSRIGEGWSIRCENVAWRILLLSRRVGPLRWDHVGVELLRNGTYERVYAGVEYPPIDWDRVAEVEASIAARLTQ